MQLAFDIKLAEGYKSVSQKIRVMTEGWVAKTVYCPNCGHLEIDKYPNNWPVADFVCSSCREDYELKSKKDCVGSKIVDGSYTTMIERLQSANNPNFFFLSYDEEKLSILNFLVIPKHFFVPEIVERRKPLAPTAQRAGWIGCNILLNIIPDSGKIFYIKDGVEESKKRVLADWKKTLFLREEKEVAAKGWLLDVMRCVDSIGRPEFTLDDVYASETKLASLHPDNNHVKDKIRQQLQALRDRGYLEFTGRGQYRLT